MPSSTLQQAPYVVAEVAQWEKKEDGAPILQWGTRVARRSATRSVGAVDIWEYGWRQQLGEP